MESTTRFLQTPPLKQCSLHFTIKPLPSVTYPFFFTRTLKTIEKQIHIVPSQEVITEC